MSGSFVDSETGAPMDLRELEFEMRDMRNALAAQDTVLEEQNAKLDGQTEMLQTFVGKYDKFLDKLIEKETARAELRKAVIEKSLTALIGAAVTAGLLLLWEGFKAHLKAIGK